MINSYISLKILISKDYIVKHILLDVLEVLAHGYTKTSKAGIIRLFNCRVVGKGN